MRQRRIVSANESGAQVVPQTKQTSGKSLLWAAVCTCMKYCALLCLTSCIVLSIAAWSLHSPAPSVKESSIEAAQNKWVRLSDGRLLEYTKCGNLSGRPVYAAPGYGVTANFFTASWKCEIAKRNGLMLMGISMPGFGLSDSLPLGYKRSLLDWPSDVAAVLRKERIERFAIYAVSAGAVHGMSVARALPDNVTAVFLGAPTAPLSVEASHGIAPETAAVKQLMQTPYIGDLLAKALSLMTARARMSGAREVQRTMDKMVSMGDEHVSRERHYEFDVERATVHTYRGWADNMHTISDDVPFSVRDLGDQLAARKVKIGIASGLDDTVCPPAMQQWWHAQLPSSDLIEVTSGWGHMFSLCSDNFATFMRYVATASV